MKTSGKRKEGGEKNEKAGTGHEIDDSSIEGFHPSEASLCTPRYYQVRSGLSWSKRLNANKGATTIECFAPSFLFFQPTKGGALCVRNLKTAESEGF